MSKAAAASSSSGSMGGKRAGGAGGGGGGVAAVGGGIKGRVQARGPGGRFTTGTVPSGMLGHDGMMLGEGHPFSSEDVMLSQDGVGGGVGAAMDAKFMMDGTTTLTNSKHGMGASSSLAANGKKAIGGTKKAAAAGGVGGKRKHLCI